MLEPDDDGLDAAPIAAALARLPRLAATINGTDDDDHLIGGASSDTLHGGAGNDVLEGGGGFDTMIGGTGDDRYLVGDVGDRMIELADEGIDSIETTLGYLSLETFTVQTPHIEYLTYVGSGNFTGTGGRGTLQITGGAGNDTLRAATTLIGGAGNDTLSLGKVMEGGAGDDTIYGIPDTRSIGGAGADQFIGGVADYSALGQALVIDDGQIGRGGEAEGDRYSGTIDIIGSRYGDTIVRIAEGGTLFGGEGNDDLTGTSRTTLGGGAGDDVLRSTGGSNVLLGGDGIDTASYAAASSGRTLSLALADNPPGVTFRRDQITDVENLVGTGFDDTLKGSGADNLIDGGGGTDVIVLSGTLADYAVDARDGGYLVSDRRDARPDGNDTLLGVELLRFADGTTMAIGALVNVAPVAIDDLAAVAEAGIDVEGLSEASGNVLANDDDANLSVAGFGESLTLAVGQSTVIEGLYGTLMLSPDGSYRYRLDDLRPATGDLRAGQTTDDVFSYTVVDARGLSATAKLNVTVTGASDTAAVADLLQVTRGEGAMVAIAALLTNDSAGAGARITVSGAIGASVRQVGDDLLIQVNGAGGSFDYVVTAVNGETATGHVDIATVAAKRVTKLVADPSAAAVDFVGREAKDALTGGAGYDRLVGNGGDDRLVGGAGDDRLDGGAGADKMSGGLGDDRYLVDHARDLVTERSDEGIDTVVASMDYRLRSYVENLDLADGVIRGTGNSAANTITGNDAANVLSGAAGADVLVGGAGDDVLFGDGGRDALTGGTGADRFMFRAGETGATLTTADRIADFTTADGDRLSLAAIDAVAATPGDDRFAFIGSAAFGGVAGELRYVFVGSGTLIEGDTDGDGRADMAIRLSGNVMLSASDFVL